MVEFISKMDVFNSLKSRYVIYGIGSILACLMMTGSAYAADNLIGQTNESNNYSSGIISIPNASVGQEPNPTSENFTLNGNATVPEFGTISYFVLILSIASVLVISTRSHLNTKI
jgi:predicted secreted protein with PEFG-CTERM motif